MAKDPKQKSLGSIFISGILTENPVLRLILGLYFLLSRYKLKEKKG